MNYERLAEKLSASLDKARDFRYFALLATFVLFADFALVVFAGQPLSQLTYQGMTETLGIGNVLIFIIMFAFFLSFVVLFFQYMLRIVSLMMPISWLGTSNYDAFQRVKPDDHFSISQLEYHAVRSGNSVAYDYYKRLREDDIESKQLNYYCLSFLLATGLDVYAYTDNTYAIFSAIVVLIDKGESIWWATLLLILLNILYLFCFYFGVICGGNFSIQSLRRIYFPNHGFKN